MHPYECWGLALTVVNRVAPSLPSERVQSWGEDWQISRHLQSSSKCLDRGKNRVQWNTGEVWESSIRGSDYNTKMEPGTTVLWEMT